MKKCMIIALAISFLCPFAYAQDDCDAEYKKLINELKNETSLSAEDQEKYIPPLERAYQLCKEGKLEEADKIVKDLKDQGLSEEVFSDTGGN